jgi:hypothetical protein
MKKIALLFILLLSSICFAALPNLVRISGCPAPFDGFNQLYYNGNETIYIGLNGNYTVEFRTGKWALLRQFGDGFVEIGIYSNACASSVSPTDAVWDNVGNRAFAYTTSVEVSGCTGDFAGANQAYAGTVSTSFIGETNSDLSFKYEFNEGGDTSWHLWDDNETWALIYQTTPVWNLLGTAWTECSECGTPVVMPENTALSFVPVLESIDVAINEADELQAIGTNETTLAGNYVQTANIDLTSIANFVPIGDNTTKFSGTYDGGNYTISNLVINRNTTDYIGLFGYITNAAACGLSNVRLIGATITGQDYTGALVGLCYGSLNNCYVKNVTVTGRDYTGGTWGVCSPNLTFNNVAKNVTLENAAVTGRSLSGIFCGQVAYTAENCSAIGTNSLSVLTHTDLRVDGGFGATVNLGTFKKCSVVGTISVAAPSAGKETNIGGFGGRANGATYEDCYARVTITPTGNWASAGATYLGDFTGRPVSALSTWRRCYAVGNQNKLFGTTLVANSVVESCLYEGTDTDQGAIGKTTAEMKTPSTYSGWNFANIWRISSSENNGYPYFGFRSGGILGAGMYDSFGNVVGQNSIGTLGPKFPNTLGNLE